MLFLLSFPKSMRIWLRQEEPPAALPAQNQSLPPQIGGLCQVWNTFHLCCLLPHQIADRPMGGRKRNRPARMPHPTIICLLKRNHYSYCSWRQIIQLLLDLKELTLAFQTLLQEFSIKSPKSKQEPSADLEASNLRQHIKTVIETCPWPRPSPHLSEDFQKDITCH